MVRVNEMMWSQTKQALRIAQRAAGRDVTPLRLATHAVFRTDDPHPRVIKLFTPGVNVLPIRDQLASLPAESDLWLRPIDHGTDPESGIVWAIFPYAAAPVSADDLTAVACAWLPVARTLSTAGLPVSDHVGAISKRFTSDAAKRYLSEQERVRILDIAADLERSLRFAERGVIHGDLSLSNVVSYQGRPTLIDFDSLAVASPLFDVASLLIARDLFGLQVDTDAVVGELDRDHELLPLAVQLRAMRMASWALSLNPNTHEEEIVKRMDWLASRPTTVTLWKAVS